MDELFTTLEQARQYIHDTYRDAPIQTIYTAIKTHQQAWESSHASLLQTIDNGLFLEIAKVASVRRHHFLMVAALSAAYPGLLMLATEDEQS